VEPLGVLEEDPQVVKAVDTRSLCNFAAILSRVKGAALGGRGPTLVAPPIIFFVASKIALLFFTCLASVRIRLVDS